jgi:hypothetical protein
MAATKPWRTGHAPVGFGEPPGGAREDPHLGRVDHRQRQPDPTIPAATVISKLPVA